MSKTTRRPPTPPHGGQEEKKAEPTPEPELPVMHGYVYGKVAKGWVLVEVETQGDKIISRNVLSRDPEPRMETLKRLFNTIYVLMAKPQRDVSA